MSLYTDDQFNSIRDYLQLCMAKLRLQDWTIKLKSKETSPEHTLATIVPIYGRKIAELRLCPDFCTLSLEEQSHTLIHELIHLHFENAYTVVTEDFGDSIHSDVLIPLDKSLRRQIEHGVDAMAECVAGLLPLIEYKNQKMKKVKKNG